MISLEIFITHYLCFRLGREIQFVNHERRGTLGIAMGGESLSKTYEHGVVHGVSKNKCVDR